METPTAPTKKFPTGTLVFGLILIGVALAALSRNLLHWSFDMPLLLISIVALAGIAMIFSGLASAKKSRQRDLPPPNDPNL